ncbi:DUF222 domain-containing protein [Microbispora sp. CA-135349]|uniref:HNH endonuclease signature motif containing protein n=1 Tax=Microbispora sp. CA-135349 TaxID=3239953 RepID=UPI003D91A6DB
MLDLLTLAVELARLPRVREKFAAGDLAAGVVEAICTATAHLSDEHASLAEPILLELAGKAGAAEVAKAGRYLRAVLDPDGEERDERADHARRFLRVRPTAGSDVRHGHPPAGTAPGASPGASLGSLLGAVLGAAPGLLLATGQMLPVSSVHRLARTSALVRLVMNADGQVLDMGRKVRLATPAQRRAVYARYATCWIDGCPLPATMCQIDHADNWSTGSLTDLKLLGPACQFHNRDRYRHPHRYTRRKISTDRWAFTYRLPPRARP